MGSVVLALFDAVAKLKDVGYVLSLSAADVQRLTRLSASDVATLHSAIAEAISHPSPVTGFCCLSECFDLKKLITELWFGYI